MCVDLTFFIRLFFFLLLRSLWLFKWSKPIQQFVECYQKIYSIQIRKKRIFQAVKSIRDNINSLWKIKKSKFQKVVASRFAWNETVSFFFLHLNKCIIINTWSITNANKEMNRLWAKVSSTTKKKQKKMRQIVCDEHRTHLIWTTDMQHCRRWLNVKEVCINFIDYVIA